MAEKRTAMITFMSIVDTGSLSEDCENLALSPTLMSCFFIPNVSAEDKGDDSDYDHM